MQDRPSTLGMVKEVPEGKPGCLKDLAFVISGVLDSLDRDAARTLIERYGGRVTVAVSGRTDFLLAGQDAGPGKLEKAKTVAGLKVIDEDGLFDLIRTRSGHSLSGKGAVAASKAKGKPTTGDIAAQNVSATVSAATDKGKERLRVHGKMAERAEDMLWVDKHRPMALKDIIGNPSLVARLGAWLKAWDATFLRGQVDKNAPKAVLISGAPGLGKSVALRQATP